MCVIKRENPLINPSEKTNSLSHFMLRAAPDR